MSLTGIIGAAAPIVQSWLSNDAAADENRSEVDLAVAKTAGTAGQLFALAYLFGPDIAVMVGLLEPETYKAHLAAMQEATPDYLEVAKETAILGIFGGATRAKRRVDKARSEKRRKAAEKSEQSAGQGPAGRSTP